MEGLLGHEGPVKTDWAWRVFLSRKLFLAICRRGRDLLYGDKHHAKLVQ